MTTAAEQDRDLIDRCLHSEGAAWDQLFARFHRGLLSGIREFLGRAGQDVHFVDEIAGRVWASLVLKPEATLARFDPRRGCRFSTFLSVMAKTQARMLIRDNRRRKVREEVASHPESGVDFGGAESLLNDQEFIASLSQSESRFLRLAIIDGDESRYSRANAWQLRHRLREKVKSFVAA